MNWTVTFMVFGMVCAGLILSVLATIALEWLKLAIGHGWVLIILLLVVVIGIPLTFGFIA